MKNKRNGFTLIELLVVVLIIGILAAVALPQYQKAVRKSRMVAIRSIMSAVEKSMKVYLLENGMPDKDVPWTDLDIDVTNVCESIGKKSSHYRCTGKNFYLYPPGYGPSEVADRENLIALLALFQGNNSSAFGGSNVELEIGMDPDGTTYKYCIYEDSWAHTFCNEWVTADPSWTAAEYTDND